MSNDTSPPDREPETARLAREVSAGELEQFDALYQRVAPALFAWARLKLLRELRTVVDPQDVVQEVWIRALEIFPRFDADRSEFRPWLFAVAKRVLLEAARRARSGPRRAFAAGGSTPGLVLDQVPESVTGISKRLARDESLAEFIAAADELSPSERQILLHFGLEGLSGDEVARRIGVSREAAFKRWQRLRERIRQRGVGADFLAE